VLADYARQRPAGGVSHRRFFRSSTGAPVNCFTVQRVFQALRLAADVKRTDGSRYQPRLHDLRHYADLRTMPTGEQASLLDAPFDRAFVDLERASDAA
jgi:hypothetical protein